MILATKAEVDEARTAVADELETLAHAIGQWRNDPTSSASLAAARTALGRAENAFAEYEAVLKTWAAGPVGGDRD